MRRSSGTANTSIAGTTVRGSAVADSARRGTRARGRRSRRSQVTADATPRPPRGDAGQLSRIGRRAGDRDTPARTRRACRPGRRDRCREPPQVLREQESQHEALADTVWCRQPPDGVREMGGPHRRRGEPLQPVRDTVDPDPADDVSSRLSHHYRSPVQQRAKGRFGATAAKQQTAIPSRVRLAGPGRAAAACRLRRPVSPSPVARLDARTTARLRSAPVSLMTPACSATGLGVSRRLPDHPPATPNRGAAP
jgi:hypothetical protein